MHGRGASDNPPNRFERLHHAPDPDAIDQEASAPATHFLRDDSKSIISYNDSPDVGFGASVNPYRGCEHGCIYCFARPTHEFLGFSAGLDFETRILVKEKAPELLRAELMSRRWEPQPLAMSGVTDPYQPIERRLGITRGCLAVLAEFGNPVVIITKNHLVTRDLDHLAALARHGACVVNVSITTLRPELARVLEPRASVPERRLAAIAALAEAGVPVRVLVAPVIPGLTDHELPAIVREAARAGARRAAFIPLRLPHALQDLFAGWPDAARAGAPRQGAESHPLDPRREAQRSEFRIPHARRGGIRQRDPRAVPDRLPQGGDLRREAAAVDGGVPAAGGGAVDAVRVSACCPVPGRPRVRCRVPLNLRCNYPASITGLA